MRRSAAGIEIKRIIIMNEHEIILLDRALDVQRLQRFLDGCSDYYLLHEACPTPPDAGEYEFSAVPEGRTADDLYVFATVNAAGEILAVAQVLSDHPSTGVWWIALLLVAPSLRSRGLGSQLLRHVCQIVRARGGHTLQLAVSVKNGRGHSFWQAAGFSDTPAVVPVTARSGYVETVQIMTRAVDAA